MSTMMKGFAVPNHGYGFETTSRSKRDALVALLQEYGAYYGLIDYQSSEDWTVRLYYLVVM